MQEWQLCVSPREDARCCAAYFYHSADIHLNSHTSVRRLNLVRLLAICNPKVGVQPFRRLFGTDKAQAHALPHSEDIQQPRRESAKTAAPIHTE